MGLQHKSVPWFLNGCSEEVEGRDATASSNGSSMLALHLVLIKIGIKSELTSGVSSGDTIPTVAAAGGGRASFGSVGIV